MFGCSWKDVLELLVLLFDAMDMLMHGNFFSEDNEESSLCRGEDIRLKQASLPPALHCFSSVPTLYMARQCESKLAVLNCS